MIDMGSLDTHRNRGPFHITRFIYGTRVSPLLSPPIHLFPDSQAPLSLSPSPLTRLSPSLSPSPLSASTAEGPAIEGRVPRGGGLHIPDLELRRCTSNECYFARSGASDPSNECAPPRGGLGLRLRLRLIGFFVFCESFSSAGTCLPTQISIFAGRHTCTSPQILIFAGIPFEADMTPVSENSIWPPRKSVL